MREQILYYAVKYDGDWKKIAEALKRGEAWEKIPYKGFYLTIVDSTYPDKLRRLQFAPWIIFYEGDLSYMDERACAIVGSRMCSAWGIHMTMHLCLGLKQRYVIVSGLAKGIDAVAHRTSLDQRTIGVVGCGLDRIYPYENASLYASMRQQHLLISEYPNGSKPYAFHFPWRNRLIAALSDALVVVEARARSGTLITVNEALELNIPVYCIPHDFGKEAGMGCNVLISQGANILVDDDDIRMI